VRHRVNGPIPTIHALSNISGLPAGDLRKSPYKPLTLLVVEKESHELDTGRHPHAVENFEQVVSNDRMLARGYSSRAVALTFYTISIALALAARLALPFGMPGLLLVLSLSVALLLGLAIWLGGLNGESREIQLNRKTEFVSRKETRSSN
jgi:hypothetical protein